MVEPVVVVNAVRKKQSPQECGGQKWLRVPSAGTGGEIHIL